MDYIGCFKCIISLILISGVGIGLRANGEHITNLRVIIVIIGIGAGVYLGYRWWRPGERPIRWTFLEPAATRQPTGGLR